MENFDYIKRNLDELKLEIAELCNKLGRDVPTLVAVTKSGTDDELLAMARLGVRDFGENRPGEVKRRGELLKDGGFNVNMHEIGTLQRNKIKLIADNVHLVHSIDTEKLAKDLDRHAEMCGRKIPVLVEINSAEEEQKSGALPRDAEALCKLVNELPNLTLNGLMTMGPVCDNEEDIRPYFKNTKKLFNELTPYFEVPNPTLSMGMSDSYRVAIEEGSTLIRVGRKLFRK